MDVLEEKENKLFERKEVKAEFDAHAGTVSRKHVLDELRKKFHGEVVIVKVTQHFGNKRALVEARVYPSKEKAVEAEPEWRRARGMPKEKTEEKKG